MVDAMKRISILITTCVMSLGMVGCFVTTRNRPDSRPVARQSGPSCPAGHHMNHTGGDCVRDAPSCPAGMHMNHVGGDCVR